MLVAGDTNEGNEVGVDDLGRELSDPGVADAVDETEDDGDGFPAEEDDEDVELDPDRLRSLAALGDVIGSTLVLLWLEDAFAECGE